MDEIRPQNYQRPISRPATPQMTPSMQMPRRGWGKWWWFVFVLAFLAIAGTAGYFYWQWQTVKKNPTQAAQTVNRDLVERVGKIIDLPSDEDPSIFTVTEPDKLQDQPFFHNAKSGFKVLVYTKAGTAYLYDPDKNKIMNVAPLNTDPTADQAQTPDSVLTPDK